MTTVEYLGTWHGSEGCILIERIIRKDMANLKSYKTNKNTNIIPTPSKDFNDFCVHRQKNGELFR